MPTKDEPTAAKPSAPAGANPLFSFVLICWNHERFVADTLRSISAQDYPNWECLVIDNGSTDGSRTVIERHIAGDARMRFLQLPENIGQLGAALCALERTNGEFVCIVDSDDLLFPSFATTHVEARRAAAHSGGVSGGRIVEIAADGSILSGSIRPGARKLRDYAKFQPSGGLPIADELSGALFLADRDTANVPHCPGTSNVYGRADLLLARLIAPEKLRPHQAADNLFFRACHVLGGSLLIEWPLSAYRITGGNSWAAFPAMLGFDRSRQSIGPIFLEQRLEQAARFVRFRKEFLRGEVERFWPVLEMLAADHRSQFLQRIRERPLREALAQERTSLEAEFGAGEFQKRLTAAA